MHPAMFPDHFSRPVQRTFFARTASLPVAGGGRAEAPRQPGAVSGRIGKNDGDVPENPSRAPAHLPEYRAPGDRRLQRVRGRPHRFPPENTFFVSAGFRVFCILFRAFPEPEGKVVQPGMVRAPLHQYSLRGLHPCEEHTLRRGSFLEIKRADRDRNRSCRGAPFGAAAVHPKQNEAIPGSEDVIRAGFKKKKIFNQPSPALRSGSRQIPLPVDLDQRVRRYQEEPPAPISDPMRKCTEGYPGISGACHGWLIPILPVI
jgi:hypothetical protein